jgi:isoquinoline 1-oxidoreductase alpha subunit
MPQFALVVNGKVRKVEADADTPVLWVLRDNLQLTGTKFGCGTGSCGACTVHQDGKAVRSCQIPVSQTKGRAFTSIEGLSAGTLHRCQQAWIDEDVAQCGYCQPGMIMEAAALLKRYPSPNDQQIDSAFAGHVCRCGTYNRLRRAVHRAARAMGTG